MEFSEKYDTLVGEKGVFNLIIGVRLSGGIHIIYKRSKTKNCNR
jgi:hypothetical protein